MNILWLTPYAPWPATHGGKIRCYNLARAMLRRGHALQLWAIANEPAEWPPPQPKALEIRSFPARQRLGSREKLLALTSRLPEAAWANYVPEVLEALGRLSPGSIDVAVLEQAHVGGLASRLSAGGIPWVLDAHNVESDLMTQLASQVRGGVAHWRMRLDAGKWRRLEDLLLATANGVIAVSEPDRQRLIQVHPRSDIAVHPNGVDTTYYAWSDHSRPGTRLLMTGTLGYRPNLDAATWLRQEIMPAIRRRLPQASIALVGGGVVAGVQALHDPLAGFEVVGPVADVRPYLAAADAAIIPLRIGSGTRLKALEALAAGLPLVGTPLAVEGLGLLERGLILVGSTSEALAAAAVQGLTDVPVRSRLSAAGREFVEGHADWTSIAEGFEETLVRVAQQARSTSGHRAASADLNQAG